jgi:MFS family permease
MGPRLPRTVVALGLVSFFNDLASEIVVPLLPILLATVLGAGPVALGLIEGVADAIAAALRLWSGRRSDLLGGRRKGMVLAGYGLSNLARPLLGLAGSWMAVLALRAVDRVGKGLRTAPRDALVTDVTPAPMRGYAYGFQRALDNAGAVGGSLIAAAVLSWSSIGVESMILLSAIPGVIAVACVVFGVREQRRGFADADDSPTTPSPSAPHLPVDKTATLVALPPLRWSALRAPMRRYLSVVGVFTLARASETFIVLLGHQRGASVVELLLLWAALSLAKSVTGAGGGRMADRIGRIAPITLSWSSLAVSFLLFAWLPGLGALWVITIGYGFFAGLGEGAERALIGDFSTRRESGTAFGWYNLVLGLVAIPSGLLFGGLWHSFGAPAAFGAAGSFAALAVVLLLLWVRPTLGPRLSPE